MLVYFKASILALDPIQPSVQWILRSVPQGKAVRARSWSLTCI